MKTKIAITLILIIVTMGINHLLDIVLFPEGSMIVGVQQLQDTNQSFENKQLFETLKLILPIVSFSILSILCVVVWRKNINGFLKKGQVLWKRNY